MATVSLKCVFASLPRTTRGQPIVINGDPKEENFLYTNGKSVFIRDIEDATKCDIYAEHTSETTVAKYSPSRFYIASGDSRGKVRIWDTVNAEHILKNEYPVIGGAITDIDWSPDNGKVLVVGDGKGKLGAVITYDSGNNVGAIDCHEKKINAASYKQTRPYCVATASDDHRINFYKGPPFKYSTQLTDHTNFVNCVRYQPVTGDVFVTGGADGKVLVWDGKTAEKKAVLGGEKTHAGGVYGLCFSPDGKELLTVSADKTAKIWKMDTLELDVQFTLGKTIDDMQVGCLWQKDNIITVSLSGYINYLDRNNPSSPRKILKGHNKPITAMAITPDRTKIYTGGNEGKIFGWDANTGLCDDFEGKGHSNLIKELVIVDDTMLSISMDDTIRFTSLSSSTYSNATSLPSQPTAMAAIPGGVAVVTCINHLAVVCKGNIEFTENVNFEPVCVDIHPGRNVVAVGSKTDKHVHIYNFDSGSSSLKESRKLPFEDDISVVKFSPDGSYLVVVTGSMRQTHVYHFDSYERLYKANKQTGRINSIAWTPNSQYFATGSLDGSIAIWCLDPKYDKSCVNVIKMAHKKAEVKKLGWLSDNVIVSVSDDCCIKQWDIKFP